MSRNALRFDSWKNTVLEISLPIRRDLVPPVAGQAGDRPQAAQVRPLGRSCFAYPPPLAGEVDRTSEASARRKGVRAWCSPHGLAALRLLGTSPASGEG